MIAKEIDLAEIAIYFLLKFCILFFITTNVCIYAYANLLIPIREFVSFCDQHNEHCACRAKSL